MLCPGVVTLSCWHRRPTFCAPARLTRFPASHCDVNKTLHSPSASRCSVRSSDGYKLSLASLSQPGRLLWSLAAELLRTFWWSSSGFREKPAVRSATEIEAVSSTICFWSHNSRSVSPRGGSGFDILTHSCRPFGWRVCLLPPGELAERPQPSG